MKYSMMKMAVALAVMVTGGSAMAGAGAVLPGMEQTTFGVQATISKACMVGNTTTMAFGGLEMLTAAGLSSANSETTAQFDAACTNGTPVPTFRFASQEGVTSFKMKGGAETDLLDYELRANSSAGPLIAHSQWAQFAGFEVDGTAKTLTVAGTITAASKVGKKVDQYFDTVTITVDFPTMAE